jgi:hypothetical protein
MDWELKKNDCTIDERKQFMGLVSFVKAHPWVPPPIFGPWWINRARHDDGNLFPVQASSEKAGSSGPEAKR